MVGGERRDETCPARAAGARPILAARQFAVRYDFARGHVRRDLLPRRLLILPIEKCFVAQKSCRMAQSYDFRSIGGPTNPKPVSEGPAPARAVRPRLNIRSKGKAGKTLPYGATMGLRTTPRKAGGSLPCLARLAGGGSRSGPTGPSPAARTNRARGLQRFEYRKRDRLYFHFRLR